MNEKNTKKQVPLRISAALYEELERWSADEFRSINGQIEYLLHECVRHRKRGASATKTATEGDDD